MRKKLIIDNRFLDIAEKKWGREYEILPSATVLGLPQPVCAHPDLSIVAVGDVFVAEKTAYDYYKKLLPDKKVIPGETTLKSHYPFDIAYNVLISENVAFANFQHIDSVVKQELLKRNFQLFDVKQGYANCSTTAFCDAVITADASILAACKNANLNALNILAGDILLDGYDYGFIGGASGFVCGKLLFFGDITKHRDYKKIKQFIESKGIFIDYIEDFPLTDVGTIIGIVDE